MQAYGTLTIVDLLDTATYIYYADDAEGHNPSASPVNKTYIGIYSGPALSVRPDVPNSNWGTDVWSGWTKYVGKDGAPGEGVTVSEIKYEYAKSTEGQIPPITGWQSNIPNLSGGDYLWSRTTTTYSDGQAVITHNVSYSGIDGSDANTYYIETNQEEILRFKRLENPDDKNSIISIYSPEDFTLKVFNNPVQQDGIQLGLTENNYKLELIYVSDSANNILKTSTIEKGLNFLGLGNYAKSAASGEFAEERTLDLQTVYFNIKKYLNYMEEQNKNLSDKDKISLEFPLIFRFSYLIDGAVAALKIFEVRDGVDEDMATFNSHAGGITAAIQRAKLDFSANGLKVFNGGISIVKQTSGSTDETVFESNTNGDLYVKGNIYATDGVFNGTVYAKDGSFSGSIQANSGNIGKLKIKDGEILGGSEYYLTNDSSFQADKIYYEFINGEYIETKDSSKEEDKDYYEKGQYPLIINENGEIYSQTITLGKNAKIEEYIQLGDARIYNPAHENNDNGLFLQAGDISLTQNGELSIGTINISSLNKSISATTKDSADGTIISSWSINGDGTAQFKEIVVDKAVVKNSVFEIGTVQAIGSLMLFKDSWKVEAVSGSEFTLSSNKPNASVNLEKDDYITKDGKTFLKIYSVSGNKITLDSEEILMVGDTITKIGKNEEYLFTILGEDQENNNYPYANSNSLTISQINLDNNIFTFSNKLVLGKLPGNKGFGLQAENVFLNGTLTTKIENGKYAGVNTLKGVPTDKFEEYNLVKITESDYKKGQYYVFEEEEYKTCEEESFSSEKQYFTKAKIVFWAGSDGEEDGQIQIAPFQVTDAGSIYANKGIFEGALITKSTIKGASIHTAKIYGEENGASAALQIYDTAKGIQFMEIERDSEGQNISEKVTFEIGKTGLFKEEKQSIISLENEVHFYGNKIDTISLPTDKKPGSVIFIDGESIGFNIYNKGSKPTSSYQRVGFQKDQIDFQFGDKTSLEIKNNLISNKISTEFLNTILFRKVEVDSNGVSSVKNEMEYQSSNDGYDLYVR